MFYNQTKLCVVFYYLFALVVLLVLGLYKEDYIQNVFFLNVCPFGYTEHVYTVSETTWLPKTGLITPGQLDAVVSSNLQS